MSKNKSWPELGVITKNEVKDKNGNVVMGQDGKPLTKLGFKLNKNVTILVDGKPFETSGYGTLTSPVEDVERMYKNGAIKEEEIEQRREKAKDLHNWLRYKVSLTPSKSSSKE